MDRRYPRGPGGKPRAPLPALAPLADRPGDAQRQEPDERCAPPAVLGVLAIRSSPRSGSATRDRDEEPAAAGDGTVERKGADA
jgi:hypothetical protein